MTKKSRQPAPSKPKRSFGPKWSAGKAANKLAQPQNRWQRAVRYIWDKNRGRG